MLYIEGERRFSVIPKFYDMTLPILQISEKRSVNNSIIAEDFITRFRLTEEDKLLKTKVGNQSVLKNRIYWSVWYLKKAGYVTPENGMYVITSEGKRILEQNPKKIDREFLRKHSPKYAEYYENLKRRRPTREKTDVVEQTQDLKENSSEENEEQDPGERVEQEYMKFRRVIEDDLLERVKSRPPEFLEYVAVTLIEKMSGGKGKVTGQTGDRGIDGYVELDNLGVNIVAIQTKRHTNNTAQVKEVRDFGGSLSSSDSRTRNGVFITTSSFTKEAYEYVRSNRDVKITLIDGNKLKQYLYDYEIGVEKKDSYSINIIDEDF